MKRRFVLETQVPNDFVRKELRCNMTNLPMRWKPIALSDDFKALERIKGKNDRIIDNQLSRD